MTTYESSQSIKYNDVVLLPNYNSNNVPFLHEIRTVFLNSIIQGITKYFPSGNMQWFDVFNPKKIPTEEAASISYGVVQIRELCKLFALSDCDQLLDDWAVLLQTIIRNENFCEYRNEETSTFVFWTQFLNNKKTTWTELTKN